MVTIVMNTFGATAFGQSTSVHYQVVQPGNTQSPALNDNGQNELSETESLRLQMMMDRKSKMNSSLSNVLKKSSQPDQQVIKNLK